MRKLLYISAVLMFAFNLIGAPFLQNSWTTNNDPTIASKLVSTINSNAIAPGEIGAPLSSLYLSGLSRAIDIAGPNGSIFMHTPGGGPWPAGDSYLRYSLGNFWWFYDYIGQTNAAVKMGPLTVDALTVLSTNGSSGSVKALAVYTSLTGGLDGDGSAITGLATSQLTDFAQASNNIVNAAKSAATATNLSGNALSQVTSIAQGIVSTNVPGYATTAGSTTNLTGTAISQVNALALAQAQAVVSTNVPGYATTAGSTTNLTGTAVSQVNALALAQAQSVTATNVPGYATTAGSTTNLTGTAVSQVNALALAQAQAVVSTNIATGTGTATNISGGAVTQVTTIAQTQAQASTNGLADSAFTPVASLKNTIINQSSATATFNKIVANILNINDISINSGNCVITNENSYYVFGDDNETSTGEVLALDLNNGRILTAQSSSRGALTFHNILDDGSGNITAPSFHGNGQYLTNTPSAIVTAGNGNVTVAPSTNAATGQITYAVSASGSGGSTNISAIVVAGTNTIVTSVTNGSVITYTVSSTASGGSSVQSVVAPGNMNVTVAPSTNGGNGQITYTVSAQGTANTVTNWLDLGDSITAGVGASIGYVPRFGTLAGVNVTNFGVSGFTAGDVAHIIWQNHSNLNTIMAGGVQGFTIMVGANDQHFSNSPALFRQIETAEVAELTLPDSYKLFATNTTSTYITINGSWTPSKNNSQCVSWAQGYCVTNATATMSFTNIGRSILLVAMSGSQFDVWIDGVFQATEYTAGNTSATMGNTNWYMTYYNPNNYTYAIPEGFLFTGLPVTAHTVTISNCQPAYIEWCAGLDSEPDAYPVLVGEVTPQSLTYPYGGSDTNRQALNAGINAMVVQFQIAGLPVLPAKTGGLNPYTQLNDGLHPNDLGAAVVAQDFYDPLKPWSFRDRTLYNYVVANITNSASTNIAVNPIMSAWPGSYAFGILSTGTTTTASIIVSNANNGTLSGSASGLSGPLSVISGATYSLVTGQATNVVVQFAPVTASTNTQTLALSGAAGTNITITASATNGVAVPGISISTANLVMANILTNTTETGTITVQNTGGGTLSGTASISSPFSITSGSVYNLTAGVTTNVVFSFTSSTAQTNTQVATFTGGAGATANVTAGATNYPAPPVINVSPSSYTFTTIITNTSENYTYKVGNIGVSNLVGTATVSAPFSVVSGSPYTVAGNSTNNVVIAFTPTATNAATNTITFTGGGGATATAIGWATNQPPVSIATGEIHAWTLSEATGTPKADSIGGATLTDGAVSAIQTNGLVSWTNSLAFTRNQSMVVSNSTMSSPFVGSFTLTCWCKFYATNIWCMVLGRGGYGYAAGSELGAYQLNGFMHLDLIGAGINSINFTTLPIIPNTNYFMAVIVNTASNTITMGMNGVYTNIAMTKTITDGGLPFQVGNLQGSSLVNDNGAIGLMTIWNRALTTNDVNTAMGETVFPPQ